MSEKICLFQVWNECPTKCLIHTEVYDGEMQYIDHTQVSALWNNAPDSIKTAHEFKQVRANPYLIPVCQNLNHGIYPVIHSIPPDIIIEGENQPILPSVFPAQEM